MPQDLDAAPAPLRDPQACRPRTNRVLVADDDAVSRRVLQSFFESWNYRVTLAKTGLEAWDILRSPDAPKLVILDWMMPGLDGPEVCRRVRAQASVPYRYILMLTSRDKKEDLIEGLESGADDYLVKPFQAEELKARIRSGARILDLQEALLSAQEALQFEATHDRLTGIMNRGAMLDRLKAELRRRNRSGEPLGVILIDIDHFKTINDTYGHLIGDVVLREIATRLSGGIRNYDWVGRYGGEEFLLVIPGCTSFDLSVLAERLRTQVASAPVPTSAGPITVTVSLGIAFVPSGVGCSADVEHLVRSADAGLYLAKNRGRNRAEKAPALPD